VRCAEAKRVVEGESCPMAYNEDEEWFDDEDEEFSFEGSDGWFEKAWDEGIAERDEMLYGYLVLVENAEDTETWETITRNN
jgi:hypothetical protein